MTEMKNEIEKILEKFENRTGIKALIISRDGLLIIPEETAIENPAMLATVLGAAETAMLEFNRGPVKNIVIENEQGKIIVMGAGPRMLLVVATSIEVGLGLILSEAQKTVVKIKTIK